MADAESIALTISGGSSPPICTQISGSALAKASLFFEGLLDCEASSAPLHLHLVDSESTVIDGGGLQCKVPCAHAFVPLLPFLASGGALDTLRPFSADEPPCDTAMLPQILGNLLWLGAKQPAVDRLMDSLVQHWEAVILSDAFSARFIPLGTLERLVYLLRQEHCSIAIIHTWAKRGGWGLDQQPAITELIFKTGELAIADATLLHCVRTHASPLIALLTPGCSCPSVIWLTMLSSKGCLPKSCFWTPRSLLRLRRRLRHRLRRKSTFRTRMLRRRSSRGESRCHSHVYC